MNDVKNHRKFYGVLSIFIIIGIILLGKQIFESIHLTTKQGEDFIVSPYNTTIPSDTNNDQTLGNPGSPLTITLFNSFNCEECKNTYKTIASFVRTYPTKAKLVWKDVPQKKLFNNTLLAHEAAFCAGEQKNFWNFVDELYESKHPNKQDELNKIAQKQRLSVNAWQKCITSEKTNLFLQKSITTSQSMNISSVPSIFINNKKINLNKDVNLEELLNSLL